MRTDPGHDGVRKSAPPQTRASAIMFRGRPRFSGPLPPLLPQLTHALGRSRHALRRTREMLDVVQPPDHARRGRRLADHYVEVPPRFRTYFPGPLELFEGRTKIGDLEGGNRDCGAERCTPPRSQASGQARSTPRREAGLSRNHRGQRKTVRPPDSRAPQAATQRSPAARPRRPALLARPSGPPLGRPQHGTPRRPLRPGLFPLTRWR